MMWSLCAWVGQPAAAASAAARVVKKERSAALRRMPVRTITATLATASHRNADEDEPTAPLLVSVHATTGDSAASTPADSANARARASEEGSISTSVTRGVAVEYAS